VQQTGGEEKQKQKQKEESTGVNDATIIQCGGPQVIQHVIHCQPEKSLDAKNSP